jgi:hypothetical protein
MPLSNPAAENWEAVYYTNPIPLTSRALLAFALLFDRIHIPGVTLPTHNFDATERRQLRGELELPPVGDAEATLLRPVHNLMLWSLDYPALSGFVHLPGRKPGRIPNDLLKAAHALVDDTCGAGVAGRMLTFFAAEAFHIPNGNGFGIAYTWPLYQAYALQYAAENHLRGSAL